MAVLDQIFEDIGLPSARTVAWPTRRPSLTEREKSSLLGSLGASAMSGMAAVGNVLDVPGSMARDILGGENPFDQLLSPFSSDGRLTGRDLLTRWGMTSPNKETGIGGWGDDPAEGVSDVGGFAAEVLLDPLTYLSLGASALTKGGQVARRAGLMRELSQQAGGHIGPREARLTTTLGELLQPRAGELPAAISAPAGEAWDIARGRHASRAAKAMGVDLADVTDQPLGGLVGVGLPFREPATAIGSGPAAQATAARLDRLSEALRTSRIGSAAGRLFNADLGDASSQVGQRIMPGVMQGARDAAARGRGDTIGFVDTLVRRGGELAKDTPESSRALRRLLEGVDAPSNADEAAVFGAYRSLVDPLVERATEWGRKGSQLFDPRILYAARRKTRVAPSPDPQGTSKLLNVDDPSSIGREWFLTHFTEGTDTLRQVLEHPQVRPLIDGQASSGKLAEALRTHFGGQIPETRALSAGPARRVADEHGDAWATPIRFENQPEALSSYLLSLDEAERAAGVFGNHPAQDLAARLVGGYQAQDTAERILTQLADPETLPLAGKLTRTPNESVPLAKLLDALDFNPGDHTEGALRKFLSLRGGQVDEAGVKAATSIAVPKDLADDLVRRYQAFKGPDAANEIIKTFVDTPTNLFKAGVLSWPARYVRDLFGGQFQNWQAGQWSSRSVREMNSLLHGRGAEIADIPAVTEELHRRGLTATPENAADVMRGFMYADGVVQPFEAQARDVAGMSANPAGSTLGEFVKGLPGGVLAGQGTPYDPRDAFGLLMGRDGTTWNPLRAKVRGVGDATETTFAPFAAGNHVGHYTDAMNRGAPYIELLRKGFDRREAAARVLAAQVDYSSNAYTAFQRQWVSRLFPFAKFTMGMVPYTLSRLWEQPGGKLAQTIRGMNRARGDDPGTPDYVAETAAIPLGKLEDGTQRFLTGFGLMHEDPMALLSGDAQGSMLELASRLNPLLRGPLEWTLGESFHHRGPGGGRDIDQLDPTLGRILANVTGQPDAVRYPGSGTIEHVLANSPVSRLLTTMRTLTDPRKDAATKAANLATGVRVADISPAEQKRAIRNRALEQMLGMNARTFERVYFSADDKADMAPDERYAAARYEALVQAISEQTRVRRAGFR